MLESDLCVFNVLQALASPTQRRNLLQELFADIALEIDERAKGEAKLSIDLSAFWINACLCLMESWEESIFMLSKPLYPDI